MLGTFINTIIVCTFTALAILSTGVWTSGATEAALTSAAFEASLPGLGWPVIAISLAIFAATTIMGWSYYSERFLQYLFGTAIIAHGAVWSLAVIVGATIKLSFVWLLADTLNAMMPIPNLIALLVLSPVVFAITKEFFDTRGSRRIIHSECAPPESGVKTNLSARGRQLCRPCLPAKPLHKSSGQNGLRECRGPMPQPRLSLPLISADPLHVSIIRGSAESYHLVDLAAL